MRVGLIGYGARAKLARELADPAHDAEVVAICDVSERGRGAARESYPDAVVTGELTELLASDLDAVMVFTPDDQHTGPVVQALEAGIAVFTEKPLAITVEDCDQILQTARRTGSRLYVGHNMRHMPVITLMKRLIDTGRIGAVKAVWCRHFVGNGGDYYFHDWHAERARTTSLLLQKGAHDIDVIHWIAGGYTRRVSAMGGLTVYGNIDDRQDRTGQVVTDWLDRDANWPPLEQTGLHPVVDVEDLSMMTMALDNGVFATYAECHYTPDYWRNYTVIGTEGRIENFGLGHEGVVRLWNRRTEFNPEGDEVFPIPDASGGHHGADPALLQEFLAFVRTGVPTETSPVAAREAVAAGATATHSLRHGSSALEVPPLRPEVRAYFERGQRRHG